MRVKQRYAKFLSLPLSSVPHSKTQITNKGSWQLAGETYISSSARLFLQARVVNKTQIQIIKSGYALVF